MLCVVCRLLVFVGVSVCFFVVFCRLLCAGGNLRFVCVVWVVRCSLFVVRCSLCVAYCLLLCVHWRFVFVV